MRLYICNFQSVEVIFPNISYHLIPLNQMFHNYGWNHTGFVVKIPQNLIGSPLKALIKLWINYKLI